MKIMYNSAQHVKLIFIRVLLAVNLCTIYKQIIKKRCIK